MGHFVGSLHCSPWLCGEVSATVSPGSAGAGFLSFPSCWKHPIADRLMGPESTQGVSRAVLEVRSGYSLTYFPMLSASA